MIVILLYWFGGIVFSLMLAKDHTVKTKADVEPWMWIVCPCLWAILAPIVIIMILHRAVVLARLPR